MISLTTFINEAISKSDITSNAKEVNDLIPILQDLGLKKTRVAKWNRSVKKALGTNKSLYVISTKGTEKSNVEALSKIISNGQIRRASTGAYSNKAERVFELTPVDFGSENSKFHDIFNSKTYPEKSPEELVDMFKKNMKADLARNEYIKKVGITNDVIKQVNDIWDKFSDGMLDAQSEGDTWPFIHDDEGNVIILFPSLFVIGKKVVRAVCIGLDMGFGEDRYKKKMNHGKFTLIFAKDDIDNLSDETE